MEPIFRSLDFLKPEECEKVQERLLELKDQWTNRAGGSVPFYTLGAATYLDNPDVDPTNYEQSKRHFNPLLVEHFSWVYEKLRYSLENWLQAPVSFEHENALPGFHLFLFSETFRQPIAKKHFDLQFLRLSWNFEEIDKNNPISFTGVITLPSDGGGLNFWDMDYDEYNKIQSWTREEKIRSMPIHYYPYEVGKLIVHKGLALHQIAPAPKMKEMDKRFTIQGHGLFCDGQWRLYW